jgi:hypothetical protein
MTQPTTNDPRPRPKSIGCRLGFHEWGGHEFSTTFTLDGDATTTHTTECRQCDHKRVRVRHEHGHATWKW